MDAWFGQSGETYVMFNLEQSGTHRWGVSVIRPNGTVPTGPNLHTFGGLDFWSNQAFYNGGSPNHIKVVGQQISNDPNCVNMAPLSGTHNVNPFLADLNCSYNTGTSLLTTSLGGHTLQTSWAGTQATSADYLTTNGFLGDMTRFSTFAAGEDANLGITDYTYITPTRSPGFPSGTGSTVLNFKFNRVDNTGNQPLCPMSFNDCPTNPAQQQLFEGLGSFDFQLIAVDVQQATNTSDAPLIYNQTSCNIYYREAAGPVSGTPVSPLHLQSAVVAGSETAQAHFSAPVGAGTAVELRIFSMLGQQVAKATGISMGSSDVKLPLPDLAPGLYAVSASVGGVATGVVRLTVR